MRLPVLVAGSMFVACSLAGVAQSAVPCGRSVAWSLRPEAALRIRSIAAGVEIVGTDKNGVRVSCSADDMDGAQQVQLQLTGTSTGATLTVTGPHLRHGNLAVRIEVPRRTSLDLEMAAGEVKVAEVVGDKDLTLRAGAITILSSPASHFREIDASVGIGQIDIVPGGEGKGGFFRGFQKKDASGEFRLHAHVTTGSIVLAGLSTQDAAATR